MHQGGRERHSICSRQWPFPSCTPPPQFSPILLAPCPPPAAHHTVADPKMSSSTGPSAQPSSAKELGSDRTPAPIITVIRWNTPILRGGRGGELWGGGGEGG